MIKQNVLLLVAVFLIGLVIQVALEWSGHSDSLGWWYTAYCAFAYAVPIFILLKSGLWLYARKKAIDNR
jgi:hypothetical protein